MIRVLVVDDDPQILRALRISLHARQYDVVTAGTGRAALDAAADAHLDLIVLDLGLPDMAGVDVIRSLRAWTQVPIVILSGWMNSAAKVDALDAGADDYVTKPFSVEELLARIRAVAQRTTEPEPEPVEPVQLGRWTVDLRDHVIYETLAANVGASDAQLEARTHIGASMPQVHLTPTEWQFLHALVRHPGRLVSQRQLLQEVWGSTYVEQTHYLRPCVKALRHKLEDDPTRPRHLITEPGMGYRFQP